MEEKNVSLGYIIQHFTEGNDGIGYNDLGQGSAGPGWLKSEVFEDYPDLLDQKVTETNDASHWDLAKEAAFALNLPNSPEKVWITLDDTGDQNPHRTVYFV